MKPAVDLSTGRLYLAWTRYSQEFCCGSHVLVASSNDHGATFTAPDQPRPDREWGASGGRGRRSRCGVVDWNEYTSGPLAPTGVAFSRSSDHGNTFTPPVDLAFVPNGCPSGDCYNVNNYSLVPATNVGAGAVPGLVLVVWSSGTGDVAGATVAAQGPGRITVLRSTDGGATFSPPQVLVPAGLAGDDQHHPWLSFARTGRIDLAYYDETVDGRFDDVYFTSSLDFGLTFGRPTKINRVPIDTHDCIPKQDVMFARARRDPFPLLQVTRAADVTG